MVKIYVDPGHGGSDPGATANGLKEKDLTLAISLKIRQKLKEYKGVSVRLSRTNDKTLSLGQRTNDANRWGADYLVSIHINAGGGTGYEDFIYNGLKSSSKTAEMREVMHDEITTEINMPNRGMKKANFHMVRESHMPAILTENGFIDASNDASRLKQESFIDDIAEGHVNGLVKLFNLKRKSPARPSPSDNKRYRLRTGYFDDAESYASAIKKIENKYGWLLHETANTTEYNPRYRIVTGLFRGRNVAEYYADQLRKEFGWLVHIDEQ